MSLRTLRCFVSSNLRVPVLYVFPEQKEAYFHCGPSISSGNHVQSTAKILGLRYSNYAKLREFRLPDGVPREGRTSGPSLFPG